MKLWKFWFVMVLWNGKNMAQCAMAGVWWLVVFAAGAVFLSAWNLRGAIREDIRKDERALKSRWMSRQ